MSTIDVVELSESARRIAGPTGTSLSRTLILEELFGPAEQRRFGVRLWNGESEMPAANFAALVHARAQRSGITAAHDAAALRDDDGRVLSSRRHRCRRRSRIRRPALWMNWPSGSGSVRALARLTRHLLALPSSGVGSVTDAPARNRAIRTAVCTPGIVTPRPHASTTI